MTRPARLALLTVLYTVQGLPYGFQATALPSLLREAGVSLAWIGALTLLAAPWSLKLLWAPWVDASRSRLGRRRGVILPMQLSMAAACVAAAFTPLPAGLGLLLALVFLMNLAAATQDVAVDGLAVDLLPPEELGRGNAAQVVGFKVGMLLGGGLLLWASAWVGVTGLFLGMAAVALLGAATTWAFHEGAPGDGPAPPAAGEVARRVWRALRRPGAGWVLLFIATYKLGETLVDVMFKPFLVDQGYTAAQLGLWVGTWGLLCSILGSVLGGLLASRLPVLAAVGIAAVLRVGPLAAQWALAVLGAPAWAVIATTCAEHLLGGVLTTAMFAFMMARVDRTVGGTHFTALAVVEVLGKAPAGLLSGVLAQALGYPALFGLGTALSLAFLALLVPLRRGAPHQP